MTDQPFSLLRNLAKVETPTAERADNRLAFVDAMSQMGIESVFDILRRSKSAFVRELYTLSDADGEKAYESARCYATQIVRLYRNQLVSSGRTQKLTRRTGVRSLVDIGPSFPNLFKENWDQFCKVGAIEAKDSPVAYLTSLYRFALAELENEDDQEANQIKLKDRRPDLKDLLIDQQSTFTPIPALKIVTQVLTKAIEAHEPDNKTPLYQRLATRQHPFQFPYNFHHQQISLGLTDKKPSLGQLNYRISLEVPATDASNLFGMVKQPNEVAQTAMSGLSPEQQAILLAPALPEPVSREAGATALDSQHLADDNSLIVEFFASKYGVPYMTGASISLDSLKVFMEKTGLGSDAVEALLATGAHSPHKSPNIAAAQAPGYPAKELSARYGACYVNGPEVTAALAIGKSDSGTPVLLNTSVDRFDRLQRMIRLQRWTNIPFADLDTLVMAVIRAEGVESQSSAALTPTVIRALGVFRHLHRRHGIKPDEFAVLLHWFPGYTSGERPALFDRVFNSPSLFDKPFTLNGALFYTSSADRTTVLQLCAGLGLSNSSESLGLAINQMNLYLDSWPPADTTPGRPWALIQNSRVISSLYRQARIASLFGLTLQHSWMLTGLLGGVPHLRRVVSGLSPVPDDTNHEPLDPRPDILDILMQLDWAADWLKETGRDVATLRQQLGMDGAPAQTPQSLLDQLNQLARDARDAALNLDVLGLPAKDNADATIEWKVVLAPLIDANGMVIAQPLTMASDLQATFAAALATHLQSVSLDDSVKTEVGNRLLEFIVKGHLTQRRLVEGLLQTLGGLPLDRCETVLRWAGSSVDKFLGQLLAAADLSLPVSDSGLTLIASLTTILCHVQVNQELGLSEQALRAFLVNPHWLKKTFAAPLSLSLASLFLLDRYRAWRDSCGQPEAALLSYFDRANDFAASLTGTSEETPAQAHARKCADLLAPLTGWNASELKAAGGFLTEPGGLASCMLEVDWLRRMHQASELTGLAAEHVLGASNLTNSPSSDDSDEIIRWRAEWKRVGEAVIAASR